MLLFSMPLYIILAYAYHSYEPAIATPESI